MPHASTRIITVRIAVARFESIPLIPIVAKIAVAAAKKADNSAYIYHILLKFKIKS